jgi:carboxyl-terminal processing protease
MFRRVVCCFALIFPLLFLNSSMTSSVEAKSKPKDYQEYLDFFEKVFKMFEDHYYLEPNRQVYNDFLKKFRTKIYDQLKSEGKSNDYVRWRSAWYLVDALKSKDDRFSQFYPPEPAKEFKQEALGQRVDLGIEGKKVDAGYLITRIEPRSDAYEKGLREGDILLKVDGKDLKNLPPEEINLLVNPMLGPKVTEVTVSITYFSPEQKLTRNISVVTKEYFRQTVFLKPTAVSGVFCLEVPKFNRTTGDDMFRFLELIRPYNPRGLVLDLRGNPGGPPLAAREISSFFLKSGELFTYFQKRGNPKDELDVPQIPDEYKFKGPIAILVDEGSGSASELFTGIMQFRGRATVFGVNTAGQVLLKSTFNFDDGSMVALVTAPGYYPDGSRFSFNGITPDSIIMDAPKDGLINFAAVFLAAQSAQ